MRLLRLDDLMTSYTNARPGASLLVVISTSARPQASSSCLLVGWILDLGTRYPYGRRSDPGAPMNESRVRAVQSRRCSKAEGKALHLNELP